MGLHAIAELLKHAPQRLITVYTSARSPEQRKGSLVKECEKWNIPLLFVSESDLNQMCGSDSHQSFAAHVKGRSFLEVKDFLQATEEKETSFVLMCDAIFDPQNFGAILRSAECFGVDAVAWSKNRGTDLTPVAAKASCGASEWISLLKVSNLADAVTNFQDAGFEVIAATLAPGAQNGLHFRFKPKTVLVVGSEGEGIQPLIQKRADARVYLPMWGKIESLNVAQATTALLTCWRSQSSLKPTS